jgi:hypothetical protein
MGCLMRNTHPCVAQNYTIAGGRLPGESPPRLAVPSALVLDIMVKGAVSGTTRPYSDHTVDKRHCERTDAAQAAEEM